MEGTLTDEDVSKSVVDANGDCIGTVVAVEDGVALVDPSGEIPPTVAMTFGWSGNPDTYPIPEASIDSVSELAVYLRSSL